ncbi:MAG: 4Fe-4S dicluster domain-containing protein [Bacteroidetes bacterium]|jgi:Na+-translocating ferredoxin:NAD+ oxidoreductase RNF subunit RnfB|nr:4Fe-4S dicluster domain-containing protein [Bacteroidota bacterium]
MEAQTFHHALTILTDVCIGCTHCMQVCPTEALRVKNGKAELFDNRCVDCGECMRVCPVNAIIVEQDDFSEIFKYKYRVALVPSVFIGQFPRDIPTRGIYSALLEQGFTHVYEAEHSAELLRESINEYITEYEDKWPVISTFCPAVVRLIQVRFPSLLDHMMQLKPPLDLAAMSYKKHLIDKGHNSDDIGIFYVTPCAAKIAAVKSPVGDESSPINGVINLNFLFNKTYRTLKNNDREQCPIPEKEQLKDFEMTWTLTSGESTHVNRRSLAIDGIHNVIEFLEKLENGEVTNFKFLELRACDESCAGGILTVENRFLTRDRLHNRAKQYLKDVSEGKRLHNKSIDQYKPYLKQHINIKSIPARSMLKLDEDMGEAMKKMERVRNLMCFLPAIDCGACGAPSCQSLAEDIVQKRAAISGCVFIQQSMQMKNKLSNDHALRIMEKTWGENRFDKDCTKKGAKDES